jgi:hypothetical protein
LQRNTHLNEKLEPLQRNKRDRDDFPFKNDDKGLFGQIYGFNSFYKIGFTREGYSFFINISKVLSTVHVRLFFNTFSHVQVGIFSDPYQG